MCAETCAAKQATPCERWPGELSRQKKEAVWYPGTLPRDANGGLFADSSPVVKQFKHVIHVDPAIIIDITGWIIRTPYRNDEE